MLGFKSDVKKENASLDPILFSGLLYYQLLTVVPYEMNNILYSSYTVTKYLQELKILPKLSLPLSKLMHDNKNECDDRMAEVSQACNIDQWLLFYLGMLDKAENIPVHMKERMKYELMMMHQKPFFRIEGLI